MNEHDTENTKSGNEAESPRIGVYICHCGGNISDIVDVEKVVKAASKLPNVVVARRDMFMCSDPGQNIIIEDIAKENLNRIVVASCSPSLHELTFRKTVIRAGLNPYLYEHANIREQVSWCSKSEPLEATNKAIRLVAAATAKAGLLNSLDPIRVDAKPHVAVIGGGVSGLRCALDLSRHGFAVSLIERSPFLGGRMAQLARVYPTGSEAAGLLSSLMDEVQEDANISVHTLAEVTAASGYIGNFELKVRRHPRGVTEKLDPDQVRAAIDACPETAKSEFDFGLADRKAIYMPYQGCYPSLPAIDWETCTKCGKCTEVPGGKAIKLDAQPEEIDLLVGAIVLATGFDPYEPRQGEYGYGEHPEVITLPQLVRMLDKEGPTGGKIKLNGRPIRNMCMIHCVGSRQVEGIHEPGSDGRVNDYCSRVCCTATLQVADEVRERFPEINIFDFYQDIRTYGRGHEDYYEDASERGVLFLRYKAEEPPVVSKAASGDASPLTVTVKDTLTWGEDVEVPADVVVLSTGMVPHDISGLVDMLKLPRSADRFLQEVHPKLQPVELAVGGVFIAGTCQGPMDITESCAAASAAGAKVAGILAKGYIELDPFVVRVDTELCRGEGVCDTECIKACAFQKALSLVEREVDGKKVKQAEVNPALCKGCGMCAAVCPYGAIQLEGWRLNQFDAMIDAIVADYD